MATTKSYHQAVTHTMQYQQRALSERESRRAGPLFVLYFQGPDQYLTYSKMSVLNEYTRKPSLLFLHILLAHSTLFLALMPCFFPLHSSCHSLHIHKNCFYPIFTLWNFNITWKCFFLKYPTGDSVFPSKYKGHIWICYGKLKHCFKFTFNSYMLPIF